MSAHKKPFSATNVFEKKKQLCRRNQTKFGKDITKINCYSC